MHRHVAVPLLHDPPVLLLQETRRVGTGVREAGLTFHARMCVCVYSIHFQDKSKTFQRGCIAAVWTHLHLSSSGLLVKAHGHGVAGYPEEVSQRHRFPLQQRGIERHMNGVPLRPPEANEKSTPDVTARVVFFFFAYDKKKTVCKQTK